MQSNNKLRPFSTNTTNIYSDAQIDTLAEVGQGAVSGGAADSKLYNSLSASTSLLSTAIADFLALNNPSITFGQTLPIESWIEAVNNTLIDKSSYTATIQSINESISNITDGTTKVSNAANADNANTLQNVDLSSSNVATFGDYIVPKMQLIYNPPTPTQLELNSSTNHYEISLQGLSLQTGDKIKIIMNQNLLSPSIKCEYVGIIAEDALSNTTINGYFGRFFQYGLVNRNNTLTIIFNQLTVNSEGYVNTTDTPSTLQGVGAIVKIYKIIE